MTKHRSFNLVALLFMGVLTACSVESPPMASSSGESLFAPMAETGITYAGLEEPESLDWGPPGIFTIENGYAIPDAIAGTIVLFDQSFHVRRTIDVSAHARGIVAVAEYEGDLVAVDGAAFRPTLLWISEDGQIDVHEIPIDSRTAPSGIITDDSGLILEYDGGGTLYRVTLNEDGLNTERVDGYTWNGQIYTLDHPTEPYFHSRMIRTDELETEISAPDHLGLMQPIGSDGRGGIYLLIESVSIDPVVEVDQVVLRMDASGDVTALARVPLDERLVSVARGVTINTDGEPVALIPRHDGLELMTLVMEDPRAFLNVAPNPLPNERADLPTIDPDQGGVGVVREGLITAGGGCLSPSQMQSNAAEYLATSAYIGSTSISNDSSCSGRETPSYLGSAGWYSSVSYNWGGFNTPSEFVSGMNSGYKAGNMNTAYVLTGCARGVDCSGFVSRVWGFTYKLSTSTIPNHSKPYTPVLTTGDVLNLAGSHVVVFDANTFNGIYAWEATAYLNLDRVASTYRSWSSLSGYQPLRSETSCL